MDTDWRCFDSSQQQFRSLLRVFRFDDRETRQERKAINCPGPGGDVFEKFLGKYRQCYQTE